MDIIRRPHTEDDGTKENAGGEHRPELKAHRRCYSAKGVQSWVIARLAFVIRQAPATPANSSPASLRGFSLMLATSDADTSIFCAWPVLRGTFILRRRRSLISATRATCLRGFHSLLTGRRETMESRYVFITERGGPTTTAGSLKMIARTGEAAKLPFPVHPHMLRHSTGYKLANDGHETRALQHYMGHKNSCTRFATPKWRLIGSRISGRTEVRTVRTIACRGTAQLSCNFAGGGRWLRRSSLTAPVMRDFPCGGGRSYRRVAATEDQKPLEIRRSRAHLNRAVLARSETIPAPGLLMLAHKLDCDFNRAFTMTVHRYPHRSTQQ